VVTEDCGICSYCISKNKKKTDFAVLTEKIIGLLKIQELNSRDIQKLSKYPKDDVIFVLQNLLENDTIIVQANNLYSIKK
jgi:ATP-dependent DNA helicase RecQ